MSDVVVIGSLNVDLTIGVPRAPARGQTLLGEDVRRGPGGKGANQAVACARLGRSVTMIGAVGADADGDWMVGLLRDEGIETGAIRRVGSPTGQAVIFVEPDGESTIVVSPGANDRLTPEGLDSERDTIMSARCVLAQQEVSLAVVERAARLARGLFVLNPAPSRPVSAELLRRVDVLVPNRDELADLCGVVPSSDLKAIEAMARSIKGPRVVVVTLGGDGALVVEPDSSVLVPAEPVVSVDATAAGDTFCAALVDALLDDLTPVEATRWATRVAAVTVTRRGAIDSIPRRSEVAAQGPTSSG
jgi:ribokinase